MCLCKLSARHPRSRARSECLGCVHIQYSPYKRRTVGTKLCQDGGAIVVCSHSYCCWLKCLEIGACVCRLSGNSYFVSLGVWSVKILLRTLSFINFPSEARRTEQKWTCWSKTSIAFVEVQPVMCVFYSARIYCSFWISAVTIDFIWRRCVYWATANGLKRNRTLCICANKKTT